MNYTELTEGKKSFMSAGRSTKAEQCRYSRVLFVLLLIWVLLNFDFVIFAHVLSLKYAKYGFRRCLTHAKCCLTGIKAWE